MLYAVIPIEAYHSPVSPLVLALTSLQDGIGSVLILTDLLYSYTPHRPRLIGIEQAPRAWISCPERSVLYPIALPQNKLHQQRPLILILNLAVRCVVGSATHEMYKSLFPDIIRIRILQLRSPGPRHRYLALPASRLRSIPLVFLSDLRQKSNRMRCRSTRCCCDVRRRRKKGTRTCNSIEAKSKTESAQIVMSCQIGFRRPRTK